MTYLTLVLHCANTNVTMRYNTTPENTTMDKIGSLNLT